MKLGIDKLSTLWYNKTHESEGETSLIFIGRPQMGVAIGILIKSDESKKFRELKC